VIPRKREAGYHWSRAVENTMTLAPGTVRPPSSPIVPASSLIRSVKTTSTSVND